MAQVALLAQLGTAASRQAAGMLDESSGLAVSGPDEIGRYNDGCRQAELVRGTLTETKVVVARGLYSAMYVFEGVDDPEAVRKQYEDALDAQVWVLDHASQFAARAFGHQPSQIWRTQRVPQGSAALIVERPPGARVNRDLLSGHVQAGNCVVPVASILDPAIFADAAQPGTRYLESAVSEILRVGGHNIWVGGSDEHRVRRVSLVFAKGSDPQYALTGVRMAVWGIVTGAWVKFDDLDLAGDVY
jgi:hypothetical protein